MHCVPPSTTPICKHQVTCFIVSIKLHREAKVGLQVDTMVTLVDFYTRTW